MDIHDYWNLPPLSQAVIRAAVLLPAPADRRATRTAETTCTTTRSRHEQTYKVLYARDLLHGLGDVENVEARTDAECLEAAELLGFAWTGTGWVPL